MFTYFLEILRYVHPVVDLPRPTRKWPSTMGHLESLPVHAITQDDVSPLRAPAAQGEGQLKQSTKQNAQRLTELDGLCIGWYQIFARKYFSAIDCKVCLEA